MDQIGDNLLFRWFIGLAMNAPVWDATTFSKNRDRLLDGDVGQRLLAVIVAQPGLQGLMSDEHFSVDGTLIQAWASHKSFQPKPGVDGNDEPPPGNPAPPAGRNAEQNWRGQKRSNETHQSLTDPDAKLARKSNGSATILAYAGQRPAGAVLPDARHRHGRARRRLGAGGSARIAAAYHAAGR